MHHRLVHRQIGDPGEDWVACERSLMPLGIKGAGPQEGEGVLVSGLQPGALAFSHAGWAGRQGVKAGRHRGIWRPIPPPATLRETPGHHPWQSS